MLSGTLKVWKMKPKEIHIPLFMARRFSDVVIKKSQWFTPKNFVVSSNVLYQVDPRVISPIYSDIVAFPTVPQRTSPDVDMVALKKAPMIKREPEVALSGAFERPLVLWNRSN
jgi:hypothetical protein